VVMSLGGFDAYWEYLIDRGIVSSAANPGFGGGPLFDMRGSVTGIVSLNLNELGRQSFAIPVEYFTRYRAELVRFGRVVSRPRRAWIGLFPQPVEDGLVVAGLVPRGPGERGGLREGDLILRVDQEEVGSRRALYEALWRHRPGERVVFEVMREHRVQRLEVIGEDRAVFYGPEPGRAEPPPTGGGGTGEGRGPRDRG